MNDTNQLIDQLVPRPSPKRQAFFAVGSLALVAAALVLPSSGFQNSYNDWLHTEHLRGEVTALHGPVGGRNDTNVAALSDGRVIQWGGRGPINDGVIYEPATGEFEALPFPDFPGRFAASTTVIQDQVMVWGGQTSGEGGFDFPRTGVIYNLTSQTWRTTSPAPVGLMDAPSVAVDTLVLIAGGLPQTSPSHPTSFLYNLVADTWSEVPLDVHVAFIVESEGRILAAGPLDSPEWPAWSTEAWQVVEFNREAREWDQIGSPLDALWLVPFSIGGKIHSVTLAGRNQPISAQEFEEEGWQITRHSKRAASGLAFGLPWVAHTEQGLFFGGADGIIRYDYASNTFTERHADHDLETWGGEAVWTGQELVALSPESNRGWRFVPE